MKFTVNFLFIAYDNTEYELNFTLKYFLREYDFLLFENSFNLHESFKTKIPIVCGIYSKKNHFLVITHPTKRSRRRRRFRWDFERNEVWF